MVGFSSRRPTRTCAFETSGSPARCVLCADARDDTTSTTDRRAINCVCGHGTDLLQQRERTKGSCEAEECEEGTRPTVAGLGDRALPRGAGVVLAATTTPAMPAAAAIVVTTSAVLTPPAGGAASRCRRRRHRHGDGRAGGDRDRRAAADDRAGLALTTSTT